MNGFTVIKLKDMQRVSAAGTISLPCCFASLSRQRVYEAFVVVWDKENGREIVLLINHMKFGATTISAICKDRWQIELLIKYLQFKSRISWSLSNLLALLRWNLFTYRNLWECLDDPFQAPLPKPESVQQPLPFHFIGQQMTDLKKNLYPANS